MPMGREQADRIIPAALTGLATRQRVISENVANVSTPGYKAAKVSFEDSLRAALDRSQNGRSDDPSASAAVEPQGPRITRAENESRRTDGNTVDVDQEMVDLADTNIRFNALSQIATNRFRLLRSVITEGRR
jgi:flagellar basal-body rod protein FlgB